MTANTPAPIPSIGQSPVAGQGQAQPASRFKPVDPLRVVRQYLVLLIIAGILGLGLGVGTYFTLRQYNPTYTSHAFLFANPSARQLEEVSVAPIGEQRQEVLARFIKTEINRLLQEEVLSTVVQRNSVQETAFIQRMKRKAEAQNRVWVDLATDVFEEEVVSARLEPGTALMRVSVGTSIQEDAPILLEALVNVYMERIQASTDDRFYNLRQVFSQERELAQDRIDELRQRRSEFTQQNNISALETTRTESYIRYESAARQRTELASTLSRMQSQYQSLQEQQQRGNLQPSPSELAQLERLRPIQSRIERLAALREQREVQVRQYGPEHRVVRNTDRMIEAVKAEKKELMNELLRKRRRSQLTDAKQGLESIKSQLESLREAQEKADTRLTQLQDKLNQYKAIEQQLETQRERRERAAESLNQLQMKMGPGATPMKRRTTATRPELTSPNIVTSIGGVTALVLALVTGLVFLRELLDQRMRAPSDVGLLEEAETLGVLPDTDEDPSGRRKIEGVVDRHPTGLMAECFRQVRTAVLSKMDRRGYRTLVVAGAQPDSGTSSVSHNLACSLSHNGRRVLVMDCNFRQPRQHELAGIDNGRGLVDVLRGEATLAETVQPIEGTNLSVLPTGEASQAQPELLESQAFRQALSQLESEYDIVILDAPPALLTSECRMLAKLVDALAVVARANRDKRGMIGRMLRQFDGLRADVLGVILNGVQSSAGGYFRKSYEAFYKYASNGHDGQTDRRRVKSKQRKQVPAQKQ